MSNIQTYMGKNYDVLTPRVEDVYIVDIAHALSQLCRFGGHTKVFYSVAQHSVFVSRMVDPAFALQGLMHDAAEAYLCDLPRPIKQMMPQYSEIELKNLRVIFERFGVPWPLSPKVQEMDAVALATEARDVMGGMAFPWSPGADPSSDTIWPVKPTWAEMLFLDRFDKLCSR